MFINLGVHKGASLLGGLSILGIVSGLLEIDSSHDSRLESGFSTFYGENLRKRSKFALS
jgi:hypothetical protein